MICVFLKHCFPETPIKAEDENHFVFALNIVFLKHLIEAEADAYAQKELRHPKKAKPKEVNHFVHALNDKCLP